MTQAQAAGRRRSPLHLDLKTGLRVNRELRRTYAMVDAAFAQSLKLSAAMVEASVEIGLEPEKGQTLFRGLANCSATIVGSREELVGVHRSATKIRLQTDKREVDFGCFGPYIEEKPSESTVTQLRPAA